MVVSKSWACTTTKRRDWNILADTKCRTKVFLITVTLLVFTTNIVYAAEGSTDYDKYTAQIGKLAANAEYKEALSLAWEFAEIACKHDGSESLYYARATSWKALLNLILGRHDASEPLFEEVLAIYEKRSEAR